MQSEEKRITKDSILPIADQCKRKSKDQNTNIAEARHKVASRMVENEAGQKTNSTATGKSNEKVSKHKIEQRSSVGQNNTSTTTLGLISQREAQAAKTTCTSKE
jgi:hypothetical protein